MINTKPLIKFLLWLFTAFIIIFVGVSGVFALEYNDIGYVHTLSGVNGQVTIDVTYETESGAPLTINRNQVIYTQLKVMNVFISNYSFEANRQYQIEMEFPYQQLQYANTYQVFGANNELCSLNYSNSIFNSQWPRWNWSCPHSTNEVYLKVYNSNNTAITSYGDWSWNYIFMRYTNTPINSDITDTDSITNNANQNADRIINNNNQNTQEIINNQNQNTQKQIESQKVCEIIDKNKISYNNFIINSVGVQQEYNGFGVTGFIPITANDDLKLLINLPDSSSISGYFCFYNINKTKISCVVSKNDTIGNKTIPNDTSYIRFTIDPTIDRPQFEICRNGNQALIDTLNDDNVDDNGVADAFESFNNFLDDNSTITQLITLPITLYTAILNNLNGTCSPFNLGELYGESLILPCINISQYLGNSLWTMIDIIISGFAVYAISKKMIKVFNNFSSLREGDVIDD